MILILMFSSGVFSGCDYDSNIALNHAIQLVGYGESPSTISRENLSVRERH